MTDSTSDEPLPGCIDCGVCCFSRLQMYVRVAGDDYERLGERADALVVFHENRAYMRMFDGHCAALRIDTHANRFVCTAYAERPATCRDLGRGTPQCLGERATKGDRPREALALCRNPRRDPW